MKKAITLVPLLTFSMSLCIFFDHTIIQAMNSSMLSSVVDIQKNKIQVDAELFPLAAGSLLVNGVFSGWHVEPLMHNQRTISAHGKSFVCLCATLLPTIFMGSLIHEYRIISDGEMHDILAPFISIIGCAMGMGMRYSVDSFYRRIEEAADA